MSSAGSDAYGAISHWSRCADLASHVFGKLKAMKRSLSSDPHERLAFATAGLGSFGAGALNPIGRSETLIHCWNDYRPRFWERPCAFSPALEVAGALTILNRCEGGIRAHWPRVFI